MALPSPFAFGPEPKSYLLFVKQRLPVRRHRSGRSGHRLVRRMRVRSAKLRAGDELLGTIVVKPSLARFETRDYRVTRGGVMFRCMLIWRTITAADVPAFGASAKMQPPSAHSQAFDTTCSAWLDRRVDTVPLGLHRLLPDYLQLRLGVVRSLQRLELIHHGRNKLRYCGMNVHRALYHGVRRLGIHDV
jgi:hypothetical protein